MFCDCIDCCCCCILVTGAAFAREAEATKRGVKEEEGRRQAKTFVRSFIVGVFEGSRIKQQSKDPFKGGGKCVSCVKAKQHTKQENVVIDRKEIPDRILV